MSDEALSAWELQQLRGIAAVLMPGDQDSPASTDISEFDELLGRAAAALGPELERLHGALEMLPPDLDWEAVRGFAAAEPSAFEVISTVAAGAYFMSPAALRSIGYPTGPRSAARFDLVADELESGILEPVIARGPRVRLPPGSTRSPEA